MWLHVCASKAFCVAAAGRRRYPRPPSLHQGPCKRCRTQITFVKCCWCVCSKRRFAATASALHCCTRAPASISEVVSTCRYCLCDIHASWKRLAVAHHSDNNLKHRQQNTTVPVAHAWRHVAAWLGCLRQPCWLGPRRAALFRRLLAPQKHRNVFRFKFKTAWKQHKNHEITRKKPRCYLLRTLGGT
jgi:hypothetical protein